MRSLALKDLRMLYARSMPCVTLLWCESEGGERTGMRGGATQWQGKVGQFEGHGVMPVRQVHALRDTPVVGEGEGHDWCERRG